MAIAHVVTLTAALSPHGGTTSAIDTTGADLIVISVSYYSALSGFSGAVSDSKGNTYTQLTAHENVNGHRLFYKLAPTVGTGHTFTISGSSFYPAVIVHAFSGVNAYAAQSGTQTSDVNVTSLQPGSLTPSMNGALVVTAIANNVADTPAVDSGLTQTTQLQTLSVCICGATGWKVQTSAAAINPTWSWTTGDKAATTMAVFTPPEVIPAPGRVSQSPLEVLGVSPPSPARVSQSPVETLRQALAIEVDARLTQAALEIIYPFGCYTYTPPVRPTPCPQTELLP